MCGGVGAGTVNPLGYPIGLLTASSNLIPATNLISANLSVMLVPSSHCGLLITLSSGFAFEFPGVLPLLGPVGEDPLNYSGKLHAIQNESWASQPARSSAARLVITGSEGNIRLRL